MNCYKKTEHEFNIDYMMSKIIIAMLKIWYVIGCIVLVIFCIASVYYGIVSYTERVIVTEKITLTGTVIDSGCIEKYINHLPTNYKTYYSVCRLKVKWNNGTETTYNYRFPALIGDCLEEYDEIFNYYYFSSNKIDHTKIEHNTRICINR